MARNSSLNAIYAVNVWQRGGGGMSGEGGMHGVKGRVHGEGVCVVKRGHVR